MFRPVLVRLERKLLAGKDDFVYAPSFNDREALMFHVGHHVRFCCVLDRNTHLPRAEVEALGAPLYIEENLPEWVVVFDPRLRGHVEQLKPDYAVVEILNVHYYPTQRPEINFHAFTPLPAQHGVMILRRKSRR